MPHVVAVALSQSHRFSKAPVDAIRLLAGLGVEGDAHSGTTVKHRSRVAKDPTQPNLRQVHLIPTELHDELRMRGFTVASGTLGENITTRNLDLLALPTGTLLRIGDSAVVEITGLRNPCKQLNDYQDGLMWAVLDRDEEGQIIRKSGVMGIVVEGGWVRAGDKIRLTLPEKPHRALVPV